MKSRPIPGRLKTETLLIVSLLLIQAALAADAPPFPPGNSHGFELNLPPGWTAVETNLLRRIRASRREQIAGMPPADGFYAYRRPDGGDTFDPPYLIVAVKSGGKLPDRFWRKLSEPGEAFRQIDGGLRQLNVKDCRLLDASFDTNLFAIRVEMEFQSESGPLRGVAASFLTENGVVEVAGLMWPSNAATCTPVIERVVQSVQFADWLRYRKRPVVDLSSGSDWLYPLAFIGVVIAGGVLFLRYLRNRDSIDV